MKIKLLCFSLVLLATGGSLFAQDFNQSYNFPGPGPGTSTVSIIGGPGTGVDFSLTGVTSFALKWEPVGSLSACSLRVDSSSDGSSWGTGDVIASQTCTAKGSASGNFSKSFVRINVTSIGGNGGLNVTLKGSLSGSGSGSTAPASRTGEVYLDPTCPATHTASCYFWNADVRVVADMTTTNGSNIMSAPDGNFTGTETLSSGTTRPWAKVGQIIQCTTDKLKGNVVLAQTTILSIDSATQIHTTGNAASNQTANALCAFGDDDTSNITPFWTAVMTQCQSRGYLSGGMAFTQKGQFNTINAACFQQTVNQFSEPTLFGVAASNTTIIPTMNFDFTTGAGNSCQGGGANAFSPTPPSGNSTVCFGDYFGEFTNINIWGLGFRAVGTTFNGTLFGTIGRNYGDNFLGWGDGLSGTNYGVLINNSQGYMQNGCSCFFGNSVVQHFGIQSQGYQIGNFVEGGNISMNVGTTQANNCVTSIDSFIGPDNGTGGAEVAVQTGGCLIEMGDFIQGSGASDTFAVHSVNGTGTSTLIGVVINAANAAHVFRVNGAGSKTYLQNTVVNGTGQTDYANIATGAAMFDECGNSTAGTAAVTVAGTGAFYGNCSFTGVAMTAGRITPNTAWGTTGAAGNGVSAVTGDSRGFTFTITATGTPGANPTITIAFPATVFTSNVGFLVTPIFTCKQVGGTGTLTNISGEATATQNQMVLTFNGTPVAASTYIFTCRTG